MYYVIAYNDSQYRTRFVRWYKDGSKFVERKHAETATRYATNEDALAAVTPSMRAQLKIYVVTVY